MIGSGIFIVSAESSRHLGAPGWLIVAWALAGLMTITGALCLAEIAAMMPQAGGPYIFLREAYSPGVGFLFGWSQFLVVQTGTIAAVAVAFANFTGVLIPEVSGTSYLVSPIVVGSYAVSLSTQQLLAIAVIVLLTFVNTRGLRMGKLIQRSFTFTKTFALFALVVVGIFIGWNHASAAFTSSWWDPAANGWDISKVQPAAMTAGALAFFLVLGRAMTVPLFSQSAWNNVTFTAEEVENPYRNLPGAINRLCDRCSPNFSLISHML
jgi:APA family basic amino acid/polyamine antiporter